MPLDWTDGENAWRERHYGESIDDAPAPIRDDDPETIAYGVVAAAWAEARATQDDEEPAALDCDARGEDILMKHIAAAIRAARRAA